ncbi:MAG: hypothetical protein CMJ58_25345 [Planctomycetaceae bacterium]|nr:hypothetical protein [Planctomycetaceae bacterium]
MDAAGCLLIVVGVLCACGLLWLVASGVFPLALAAAIRHPVSIDGAILATLLIGACVCLPIGTKIIRRGLPR